MLPKEEIDQVVSYGCLELNKIVLSSDDPVPDFQDKR